MCEVNIDILNNPRQVTIEESESIIRVSYLRNNRWAVLLPRRSKASNPFGIKRQHLNSNTDYLRSTR